MEVMDQVSTAVGTGMTTTEELRLRVARLRFLELLEVIEDSDVFDVSRGVWNKLEELEDALLDPLQVA